MSTFNSYLEYLTELRHILGDMVPENFSECYNRALQDEIDKSVTNKLQELSLQESCNRCGLALELSDLQRDNRRGQYKRYTQKSKRHLFYDYFVLKMTYREAAAANDYKLSTAYKYINEFRELLEKGTQNAELNDLCLLIKQMSVII